MPVAIRIMTSADTGIWDAYVSNNPCGNVYQLSCWCQTIRETYGHSTYNLMAVKADTKANAKTGKEVVVGVLPLVHIKHLLFGNKLFSMPYADLGGLTADTQKVEQTLLENAIRIAHQQNIPFVELRQSVPLSELSQKTHGTYACSSEQANKVRMLLELPDSSEKLMNSFKSKLRSQIRRPLKDGLNVKAGGLELLNDFYPVFAENMRDLGSPVHAKAFIKNVVKAASDSARLFIVYQGKKPLACSFTLGCGSTLANPWASSLRKFSALSPNMLLYWAMLEYGCDNGYKTFDFGRSTPGEGTYKFKKQWGAVETPLNWYVYSNRLENTESATEQKSKFAIAMALWKKLPVSLSKVIGPVLRKNIGL